MKLTKNEIKVIVNLLEREISRNIIDIKRLYINDKDKIELRKELVNLKRVVKKLKE